MSIALELKSIDLVATWKYNCKNTECMCNRSLYLPIVTKVDTNNISTDNIIIGECGHGMHKSCIESYLKTCNNTCPIDKLQWTASETNKPTYYIVDN